MVSSNMLSVAFYEIEYFVNYNNVYEIELQIC